MKKKNLILCAIVIFLSAIISLYIFGSSEAVTLTVNGEEIDNPLIKGLGGIFAVLVGVIALTIAFLVACLAMSGVGLILFGVAVLLCLIAVGIAVPFSLPVIIPLLIVTVLFMKNE